MAPLLAYWSKFQYPLKERVKCPDDRRFRNYVGGVDHYVAR